MIGYVNSLGMGLAVDIAYGLVHVRSPAPLLIALVGLLGMVLGEQAVNVARPHLAAPAQSLARQDSGDVPGPSNLAAGEPLRVFSGEQPRYRAPVLAIKHRYSKALRNSTKTAAKAGMVSIRSVPPIQVVAFSASIKPRI